ncbi:MAG: hypothetical protein JWQ76_1518 [Ramlibacter sp.]|nr:hypothetical protein [Ramlibacter sp.]
MDASLYFAAWVLAALVLIGLLSAVLARTRGRQDLRRLQAEKLNQALERYSAWVCAQRLAAVFNGESAEAAAALDEACTTRMAWFPELSGDMAELTAVHNRLVNFLHTQQALWLRDPERWIESEHDHRFLALWRQHRLALEVLHDKLQQVASVRLQPLPGRRRSTYA